LTLGALFEKSLVFTSRYTPNLAASEPRTMGAPAVRELCEDGPEHRFSGDIPPARKHCTFSREKRESKPRQHPVGLSADATFASAPHALDCSRSFRFPQKHFPSPGCPPQDRVSARPGSTKLVLLKWKPSV